MTETVLIIDDNPVIRKALTHHLEGLYEVLQASSGEQGIEQALAGLPSVILLDVEMPGLNGYEVCDRIRNHQSIAMTPVMFITSHTSLQERMVGYESGADDYLNKSCDPQELIAKIQVLIKRQYVGKVLEHRVGNAQKMATDALIGTSELGGATLYIEQTYLINDLSTLASKFFAAMDNLGLNCSLMIDLDGQVQFFSMSHDAPPMEQQLMQALKAQGRFKDFGMRTQINYDLVSLLVKNMPLNDPPRYGRYKDLLPTYLAATDARLKNMRNEQHLRQEMHTLQQVVIQVNQRLHLLKEDIVLGQTTSLLILRQFADALHHELPKMGLEDDQEAHLLNRVDTTMDQLAQLSQKQEAVEGAVTDIKQQMQQLLDQHQHWIDEINRQQMQHLAQEQDKLIGAIELF